MGFNKLIYKGVTKIDLTADTATAEKILTGYTAHDKTGTKITGTCEFDVDSGDATVMVSEILSGKTAYARGAKLVGDMPNNGGATLSIGSNGKVSIPMGFHDGSGEAKIPDTDMAKLIAENIRQGITILGRTGTLQPSSSIRVQANKTVTPDSVSQTVSPDSGYDYLAQVIQLLAQHLLAAAGAEVR